ncbi:MAG: glycogen-binding domain-containing protein [Lentisphaeria bacterium]|nr:glycogen-binding domain-containing protein [Lentisphaeria bacterium]
MNSRKKSVRAAVAAEKKAAVKKEKPAYRMVTLVYEGIPGRQVFAAGTFNGWKPEKAMRDKDNNGIYRCQIKLVPGEYQYKFVVDGNWCLDAANPNFTPNEFGTLNSILVVDGK